MKGVSHWVWNRLVFASSRLCVCWHIATYAGAYRWVRKPFLLFIKQYLWLLAKATAVILKYCLIDSHQRSAFDNQMCFINYESTLNWKMINLRAGLNFFPVKPNVIVLHFVFNWINVLLCQVERTVFMFTTRNKLQLFHPTKRIKKPETYLKLW